MAMDNQTTNSKLSRERAEKMLADGKVNFQGLQVNIFDNTLSTLPPIKNDELQGHDFVIGRYCGDINTEYGVARIFEVGMNPQTMKYSWLVGAKSIIGDNIQKQLDRHNGKWLDTLPLWVSLAHYTPDSGQAYWCLERPRAIQEALETASVAPLSDMEDLPF